MSEPTVVKCIVAMDPNGLIGLNGDLPWRYKADLKRFKAQTMGGILVMGRKTFESLPKKKLPGREIIVLTSQKDYEADHVAVGVLSAVEQAARIKPGATVWLAGGAGVYTQALYLQGLVDEVDLTMVPEVENPEGERVHFPVQTLERLFELVEETANPEDENLRHRVYKPKKA